MAWWITNSGRYEEALAAAVQDRGHVIVRAGADCRPTLVLTRPLDVTGGVASAFSLEGLLVSGNGLRVAKAAGNKLARLRVVHATLVPGQSLSRDGAPVSTSASVEIALLGVALELSHAIVGALRVVDGSTLAASNSIVDATEPTRSAFCAPNGTSSGGEMSLDACTVIGKINAESFGLVSNSILLARRGKGDTLPPVRTVRRQAGCVRFSYLPFDSLVPRRHRCQPATATVRSDVAPRFTTLRYGVAAYCQLSRTTPDEIRLGADDESEMGAFHALFAPQREANLQIRLREFLRVGLVSGILYES
jgi:hypothetical protein